MFLGKKGTQNQWKTWTPHFRSRQKPKADALVRKMMSGAGRRAGLITQVTYETNFSLSKLFSNQTGVTLNDSGKVASPRCRKRQRAACNLKRLQVPGTESGQRQQNCLPSPQVDVPMILMGGSLRPVLVSNE